MDAPTGKKKRESTAEFEKRLESGDPEATEESIQELKLLGVPLEKWGQGIDDDPTGKKKRESWAEFEKRLKSGDLEATDEWNKFIQELKLEGAPLLKWAQEIDDDPLARSFMVWLVQLSEHGDPRARTLAKNLDIDNLHRMIRAYPEELKINTLPDALAAGQRSEPAQEAKNTLLQKGRYRLTPEEIKVRKKQVSEAKKLKKLDPSLGWKEIAKTLGVPERTLRDRRHNPLY
jgi:hypothetical protein